MKWIAKRDFLRTPKLKDIVITGACKGATVKSPHPNHLQKGGIFELGNYQSEADFQKAAKSGTDPLAEQLSMLRYTSCISDAADAECVARIEAEIENDAKREKNATAIMRDIENTNLVNQFVNILKMAAQRNAPAGKIVA